MAYSTPITWTAGSYPTAAQFNANIRDNVSFLANPPACRVYHNAAQALTTAVEASLAFNSERFDTNTMHDTVTNNSRITFTTAGLYVVTLNVTFASNATGNRVTTIRLNGATYLAYDIRAAVNGDTTNVAVTTIYKFAAADYVEARCFQNSGGNLNVNSTANSTPEFAATWIGLG